MIRLPDCSTRVRTRTRTRTARADQGGTHGAGGGEATAELDGSDDLRNSPADACPVTPRSILEAVLFVGHPANQPLSSREVARLMRGVRPAEVDQLVRELNAVYAEDGSPYFIESLGSGYRMTLRRQYQALREKFYGRVRQARLSQPALDVLAIVAYRQPVLRAEVDQLRGKPSGAILTQLVRRQLLRIEHRPAPPRAAAYYTTDRFLAVFGLESLDDLPREQDMDMPSHP